MKNAEASAYEMIMNMILSRSCGPGDRLVELEIAEQAGLSRTPVRNAMRQLAAEGLLENRGNKGCYIPQLTPQDMAEVFKIRGFLEGKAALEAAYNRTDEDLKKLHSFLDMEKEYYRKGSLKEYASVNDKFHLFLGKLSKNSYIEKFSRQAFLRSGLYIFYFDRFYAPSEHGELLRDPAQSVSCIEHEKIF